MAIYIKKNSGIKSLEEEPFSSEKEMQGFVQKNLDELFGLKLIAQEFAPTGDRRIDTLAFDTKDKNFVIIEYKKGVNWSVVDQGYTYLSLLLDRKADFVLKLNGVYEHKFSLGDINWEGSRVIFIAPSFTTYQTGSLGFQDIAFELYKLVPYKDGIISLEQIQNKNTQAKLSEVKEVSDQAKRVQKEVKSYNVDYHFRSGWEVGRELFDELSNRLLELDSRLSIKPVKTYIGINMDRKNIFSVHSRLAGLVFHIVRFRPKDLKDPAGKLRYLPNSKKYFNVHISEMRITSKADIDYAILIAREALGKYK